MTTLIITTKIRTMLFSSALLLSFAAAQPRQGLAFPHAPVPPAAADDSSAYAVGVRAMNEHRWQDAISAFDKVIDAKDNRSAAALYWKAYSLNKLQRYSDAGAICNTLRGQYADSSWNKDCAALSIDTRNNEIDIGIPQPNINVHIDPIVIPNVDIKDNTDLKILALNSLLNQDPAKAIPVLRGILDGNQPIGVKKHAIFVLAQSKSPESQSILRDALTGKMGPEVQREAIRLVAVFQGKRANDTLAEIYRTTSDQRIKKSIISDFFITQDAPRLVELARNEKDLNLKRTIVSQLALMHDKAATDYMMELLK